MKMLFYALALQMDGAGSLRGSELEKGWDRAAALDSPEQAALSEFGVFSMLETPQPLFSGLDHLHRKRKKAFFNVFTHQKLFPGGWCLAGGSRWQFCWKCLGSTGSGRERFTNSLSWAKQTEI